MDLKNVNRLGSRKVIKKIENTWTEVYVQNAIHKLDVFPGKSIREVVKQLGLWETTIRFRRKKILVRSDIKKAGRTCSFDRETRHCWQNLYQLFVTVSSQEW